MMSPEFGTDIKDTRQAVDNIEKYFGSEEDFRKVINYIEPNKEIADRLFNTLSNSFKQKDINSFSDKYTNIYMRVYQDVYNWGRLINSGNTPMGLNSFKEYFAQKTQAALEMLTKEKEDARLKEDAEKRRQSKIDLETQQDKIINTIKSLSESQKNVFAKKIIENLGLSISDSELMEVLSTEELSKTDSYKDFVLNIVDLDIMNGAENEYKLANNLAEVSKVLSETLQLEVVPALEKDIAIDTEPNTAPNSKEDLADEPSELASQVVEEVKAPEEINEDKLTVEVQKVFNNQANKSTFDLSNEILKILPNKEYLQPIINLLDLSKSEKDTLTAIQEILKRDNTEFTEEDYSELEITEEILQQILSSVAYAFEIKYTPAPTIEHQTELAEETAVQEPLLAEDEEALTEPSELQPSEQENKLSELKSFYEGKIEEYDALHQDRPFADLANSKKFIRILEFSSKEQLDLILSLGIFSDNNSDIAINVKNALESGTKIKNLQELAKNRSTKIGVMKKFLDEFVNNFHKSILKSENKPIKDRKTKIEIKRKLDEILQRRSTPKRIEATRQWKAEEAAVDDDDDRFTIFTDDNEVPPAEITEGNSENITDMDDLSPIKQNLLPEVNVLMKKTFTEQELEKLFSIENDEDAVDNIISSMGIYGKKDEYNNVIKTELVNFYGNDSFDYSDFIKKHGKDYDHQTNKFLVTVFLLSVLHELNMKNGISKQKLKELQEDILINTNIDSELKLDSGKLVSAGEAPANSEPVKESEIAFEENSLEANLYELFTELDQEYKDKILANFNNDATAKKFTFEEIISDPNNLEKLTETIRKILFERQDEIENYLDFILSFVKLDTYFVEEMIDKIKKISDKNFRNLFSIRLLIGLNKIHSAENFDYSNVIKLLNETVDERSDEEEQPEEEKPDEEDDDPRSWVDKLFVKAEDRIREFKSFLRKNFAEEGSTDLALLSILLQERLSKKENTLAINKVASLYNILYNLIDKMGLSRAKHSPEYQINYLIDLYNGNRADNLAKIYRDIFDNVTKDKSNFRNWVKKSVQLYIDNKKFDKAEADRIKNLINSSLFGGTWNKIASTGRDIYDYIGNYFDRPAVLEDKVNSSSDLGSIFNIFQGAYDEDSEESQEFIKIINDAAGEFITTYYNEHIDPYEFLTTLFKRAFDPQEKKKLLNAFIATFIDVLHRDNMNKEFEEMKKSIESDEIPAIISNKTYAKSLVINIVREFIGRQD